MSQLQFSSTQYVNLFDTNDEIKAGSFKTVEDLELDGIYPLIFCYNKANNTEEIRCNVYSDSDYDALLFSSSWCSTSEIVTSGYSGRVYMPITFNRESINKDVTYYITFEVRGYTKSITSYMSIEYDLIDKIYTSSTTITNSPFRILVFGHVKPV